MEVNGNDFLKNVHKEHDDGRRRLDEFQQSSSQYDDYENPKDDYYNEKSYDDRSQRYEDDRSQRYEDDLNKNEQEYIDRTVDYTSEEEIRDTNTNNSYKYTQNYDDRDGLSDLLLNNKKSNKDKKKYIAFGLGLVVLFLLIIVIVRIASNNEVSDNSLLNENSQSQDNTTSTNNGVEEKYQQIINEKLKQINEEKAKQQQASSNLDIDKVQGQEKAMENSSTDNNVANTNDVLNVQDSLNKNPNEVTEDDYMKKDVTPTQDTNPIVSTPTTNELSTPAQTEQPVVKKTTPKVEQKPKTKEIDFANVKINKSSSTKSSSNVYDVTSGKYIQIGAFSKEPDDKFFNKITNAGYTYKILKVNINGTLFYKVLIGPFDTHEAAKGEIPTIKSKLNAPNAFLVKI